MTDEFRITTLRELLESHPDGRESPWRRFATLRIVSGRISVSDPAFFRDLPPPPTFQLRPGEYDTYLKEISYPDGDLRVSRLRVSSAQNPELGPELDNVSVDFAQVGVFDPAVLDKASCGLTDEQALAVLEQLDTSVDHGIAVFNAEINATMPFVRSGFGDGGYPIFDLLQNGARVGLEVVFIGPELTAA